MVGIEVPRKEILSLIRQLRAYAKRSGFRLNPSRRIVEATARGILLNESRYGGRYCPCRPIVQDQRERTRRVCPCVYHKQEIEEKGRCLCRLFVKGEANG